VLPSPHLRKMGDVQSNNTRMVASMRDVLKTAFSRDRHLNTLPNGYEYEGNWATGEIKGKGVARFPTDGLTRATLQRASPDGFGKITLPDGGSLTRRMGTRRESLGQGIAQYANGVRYGKGSVRNANQPGKGVMHPPAAMSIKMGDWVDGVKQGVGQKITYPDGAFMMVKSSMATAMAPHA